MIKVTCACGASFAAIPELAGKRVPCPACHEPLQIPDPNARLRVDCACGRTIKAKPEMAGRRVKCPACTQPLVIPEQTVTGATVQSDPLTIAPPDPLSQSADPLTLPSDPFALPNDPLALPNDPLALPNDPLALPNDPLEDLPLAPAPATLAPKPKTLPPRSQQTTSRQSGTQRAQDGLIRAAGLVAVIFGCFMLIWQLVFVVRFGFILSVGTAFQVLGFLLAGWLAKSGLGVLQARGSRSEREALSDAGTASTVYLVLTGLNLVNLIVSMMRVGSLGALGRNVEGMLTTAFLMNLIYLAPPAFVVYVQNQKR